MMYASEAELNEVEAKFLAVGLPIHNLETQYNGTYSFESVQSVGFVRRKITEAGFECRDWDLNSGIMEYTIAPLPATEPTAAALEAYPDLYRSGDYSVYYDPDYQEYIVASGGGDPLSARKTLDEAKAIADAYASEGDKAEPTAAAQGEGVPASVDDLSPAQKEVWVRLALNQADVQIASLEAALQQAQRERDAALDVLRDIARNAPQVQPSASEQWKWTFWFAGSVAKSCVDTLATQASAQQDAQPADGEG